MADADQNEAEATPAAKKPILLIAGVVVVAIAASVGGTLYFVKSDAPVATAEVVEPVATKALYHSLRPAFVVNYATETKSRYLQAEITLMARNAEVIEAAVDHGPLVRSQILQFLSDQGFSELRTDAGKLATREGIKERLNQVLAEHAQVSGIESVLLTNFVLQ